MAQLLKRTAIRTFMDQKQQINGNQAPWAKKRHTPVCVFILKFFTSICFPSAPLPLLYFDEGLFFVIKFLGKRCFRMTAREASSPYVICCMYLSFCLGNFIPLIRFVLAILCRKRGEDNCGLSKLGLGYRSMRNFFT